jgi:RNA polymerase sigma-70 factor (ECF subfamily)
VVSRYETESCFFSEKRVQNGPERKNPGGVLTGNTQAYEALIFENYRGIYSFLAYLTANTSLAEDLTQDTFAAAWAKIDDYKGTASIGTWLHKIAYHKFIDAIRKDERHSTATEKLQREKAREAENKNPLNELTTDEESRILCEAIRELQRQEHIVIVLHYIQGLSYREMAEILDKPTGTVKWQTNRALKKLKTILTGRM